MGFKIQDPSSMFMFTLKLKIQGIHQHTSAVLRKVSPNTVLCFHLPCFRMEILTSPQIYSLL